jgi:GNAT superfamily N-acetyltransferase
VTGAGCHHGAMPVVFRRCDPAVPPACDLIVAILAEYDAVAGRALRGGPSATAVDFSAPGGAYLVGFDEGGQPACGGGVKALGAGVGEVKRFYVVPEFRGRGLARALLEALEGEARRLGHRTLRLDATTPTWPMYVSAGYRAVPDYNGNPHATVWGEKDL